MKNVLLLVLVVIGLAGSGCKKNPNDLTIVEKLGICALKDYGNGVYFFRAIGDKFAISLSGFLTRNPNLELITFNRSESGILGGYLVAFKVKTK